MGSEDDFSVDTDELVAIVRELVECRDTIRRSLADLDTRMKVLQDTWQGLSADAQAIAQAEWVDGMETMDFALVDLTEATEYAESNYSEAVRLNLGMWQDAL